MSSIRQDIAGSSAAAKMIEAGNQLMQQFQQLQKDIRQELLTRYAKAFDESYAPNWWKGESPELFSGTKKPIARQLKALCERGDTSLAAIADFVFQYKKLMKDNAEKDPVGMLDSIRSKCEGGELGGVFSTYLPAVLSVWSRFNSLVSESQELTKKNIHYYHLNLSMKNNEAFAKEINFYLKDKDKVTQSDGLVLKLKDGYEAEPSSLSSDELNDLLDAERQKRVELNVLASYHTLPADMSVTDRVRYFVIREIVLNFTEFLQSEADRMPWKWYVRSLVNPVPYDFKSRCRQLDTHRGVGGVDDILRSDVLIQLLNEELTPENIFDLNNFKEAIDVYKQKELFELADVESDQKYELKMPDCDWRRQLFGDNERNTTSDIKVAEQFAFEGLVKARLYNALEDLAVLCKGREAEWVELCAQLGNIDVNVTAAAKSFDKPIKQEKDVAALIGGLSQYSSSLFRLFSLKVDPKNPDVAADTLKRSFKKHYEKRYSAGKVRERQLDLMVGLIKTVSAALVQIPSFADKLQQAKQSRPLSLAMAAKVKPS